MQQINALGYRLDSASMTVSLQPGKLQKMVDQVLALSSAKSASARQALSMAGRLMDARFASSLFRACAYALYPHVSSAPDWDSPLPLPSEVIDRLQFFAQRASSLNGSPFGLDVSSAVVLSTDARTSHWSLAILKGPHAGLALNGSWAELAPSLTGRHINYLELLVLRLALQRFRAQLSGAIIWWWVDNMVALSYLRKCGGPVQSLRALVWDILLLAREMGVIFTAPRYVKSKDNPTDYGTRHRDLDSVRICPYTFEQLNLRWGPFSHDLFATAANAMCPSFFSPAPEEGSAGTDALQQDWSTLRRCWIFPPSHLLAQTLDKISRERPAGVLVVPHLPEAPWWPQFKALSLSTAPLQQAHFKVDGPEDSSIFLRLSERFWAARIR